MHPLFSSLARFIKMPDYGRFAGPMDFLAGRNHEDATWKLPLILAICVHLLTFLLAMYGPVLFKRNPRIPEVYTVNLYTAPELLPPAPVITAPAPPSVVIKDTQPPKIAKPVDIPKPEAISLKPLKAKLKEEEDKRKKDQQDLLLAERLKNIKDQIRKQEAEEEAKKAAQQAINKLTDLFRSQENAKNALKQVVTQAPTAAQTPGPKTGEFDANLRLEAMARYKAMLFKHIHNHWTLPDIQNWKESLEAVIVVLTKRDGTVINTYFEKRSDDLNFNREVEKAIRLSSPLPPFPPELDKDEEELVITFFPSGLF